MLEAMAGLQSFSSSCRSILLVVLYSDSERQRETERHSVWRRPRVI
eukprot:COSAG03_NODE_2344_length_2865_cov_3.052422_2_plen_46_part_00